MHIVLFEPEIPPNTGNIARLCAVTDTELHLIEPLGFSLDQKYVRRAGLDYWQYVKVFTWKNLDDYVHKAAKDRRLVMTSSKGGEPVHQFAYTPTDSLIFGPETRGLPQDVLAKGHARVRIPMRGEVRSLNLSNAASVVLYMALAKCDLMQDWV